MFNTPFFHRGTIHSDEGFRVVLIKRYFLTYEDRQLSLLLTRDSVPGNMDIFRTPIKDSKTGELVILDELTHKRVFDNMVRALEWKGYQVRVIS